MNKAMLVGRISFVNQIEVFESGSMLLNFGIATTESFKKNNEWVEEVTFHSLRTWNKTAEYIEKYIRPGDLVEVEGKIRVDKWEAEDGKKKSYCYVQLEKIKRLIKKEKSNVDETTKEQDQDQNFAPDDIPF